ncbi:MAG: ExbD/TolR family protein [Kiritimatiellia bacterium]|jgi:biopolymer transport protein TolR
MRRRREIHYIRPKVELNLTSMMDLTFLLLITFIITFPLIEQGLPVALPKGKSKPIEADNKPAIVTVDAQGRIYLGQTLVTLDDLNDKLRAQLASNDKLQLIIRGDKAVNYGTVVDVAQLATDLGISRMALATSPKE